MAEHTPRCVLVTGGAGFIASSVVTHLLRAYPAYKLVVVDKLDYCSSLKNLAAAPPTNFKFIHGDITTPGLVLSLLRQENVDTVMHFAAQTHVDCSFANSLMFTHNNVVGTHMLLEACKACGPQIARIIHVSTDEVYGENEPGEEHCFRESDARHPTNPYAATKASAEMLVEAYIKSYRLPIIVTRGNNVYGPRQYPEKVIPKFIILAMRGAALPVHGAGMQRRSFMHVSDATAAFDTILHKGKVGAVYNIGSREEHTALDIARHACAVFGRDPAAAIAHVADRDFNDQRYFVDASALAALGWEEKTSFAAGFAQTVAWYRQHADYWPDIDIALLPHPGETRTLAAHPLPASDLPIALISSTHEAAAQIAAAAAKSAVELFELTGALSELPLTCRGVVVWVAPLAVDADLLTLLADGSTLLRHCRAHACRACIVLPCVPVGALSPLPRASDVQDMPTILAGLSTACPDALIIRCTTPECGPAVLDLLSKGATGVVCV